MGTGSFSDPRILRIELPPGLPLLSSNDRLDYFAKNKLTRRIKEEVVKVVEGEEPFTSKVRIRVIYYPPNRRRRDPGNFYPSAKAAIDALVPQKDRVSRKPRVSKKTGKITPVGKITPAGPFVPILKDDSCKYVTEIALVIAEQIVPAGQLVLQVIEVPDDERP